MNAVMILKLGAIVTVLMEKPHFSAMLSAGIFVGSVPRNITKTSTINKVQHEPANRNREEQKICANA